MAKFNKREMLELIRKRKAGEVNDREILDALRGMKEPSRPVKEFATQFTASIADTFDSMTAMGPIGGLVNIPKGIRGEDKPPLREQLSPFTAAEEPSTLAGEAGSLAGAAAAATPIIGGVAGAVPKAVAGKGAVKFFQNIANKMGTSFASAPVKHIAIETALGASSGVGGFLAEQKFPDSDAAKFIGEIVGGTAPQAIVPAIKGAAKLSLKTANILPGVRLALRRGRGFLDATTLKGGKRRAIDRFKRASPALGKAAGKAGEELLQGFTPAQKTGNAGLLALERDVIESSDLLVRESDDQISKMNELIDKSLKSVAGPPEVTDVAFEQGQQHLTDLLDTRLVIAAQRVDERIQALSANATAEQANRIGREEIEKVVKAGVAQENELFNAIPKDAVIPTSSAQELLESELKSMGAAQRGDIPKAAKAFLNPKSGSYLGEETTIREARSLQVKLREQARKARTNKSFNKARIADDIADAITEDISFSSDPQASEMVESAVRFSRNFRKRTRGGTMGKLLGVDASGAPRVPASLTFESSIGFNGPKSREAYDNILKAFDSPEAPNAAVMQDAAENYVRNRLVKARVLENGKIDVDKARTFLINNAEILDRMPNVKGQIENGITDNDAFALLQGQKERSFMGPRRARAALYLKNDPNIAITKALESSNPASEVNKLTALAKNDNTGTALEGLKESFIEHLSKRSSIKKTDIKDRAFVSGMNLDQFFKDKDLNRAMKQIFNPREQKRLEVVVRSALRLDKARAAKPSIEGIIGDQVGATANTMAGALGAAFGRNVSKRLGGGTVQIPGIFASRFRNLLSHGVLDPAKLLIMSVVKDEKLFKEVLLGKIDVKTEKLSKEGMTRLNAWFAAVLRERGIAMTKEEKAEMSKTQRPPPAPLPRDLRSMVDTSPIG